MKRTITLKFTTEIDSNMADALLDELKCKVFEYEDVDIEAGIDEGEPYEGAEEATPERVRRYLEDGFDMSTAKAAELCEKHKGLIEQGQKLSSFAYYVGNEIIKAEEPEEMTKGGE